jgi:hypothetical protein
MRWAILLEVLLTLHKCLMKRIEFLSGFTWNILKYLNTNVVGKISIDKLKNDGSVAFS